MVGAIVVALMMFGRAGTGALATGTTHFSLVLSVNGALRSLPEGAEPATVGAALRAAGVHPAPGHLRAFRSGRTLDGGSIPARVLLDGAEAGSEVPLAGHHRLDVIDGSDAVEPVVMSPGLPVPADGPPAVEYGLFHPATPGSVLARTGVVSGERVEEQQRPPVPASAVTEKVVALTFDDGPWPDTPEFLKVLHDEGVRATFCMIGRQVTAMADVVRQVAAAGMTICNHTADHNMFLDRASPAAVRADIQGGADALTGVLGHPPGFYRPPGGTLSPEIVGEAHRVGERVIHWTLDSMDYRRPGASTIAARVVALTRPGTIVLMHDGGGDRSQTLAALPTIIESLHALGYVFATPDGIGASSSTLPATGRLRSEDAGFAGDRSPWCKVPVAQAA